jgi:DEAD/DEAH box helicase domain-containing protein
LNGDVTVVATWNELLAGDELAHLATEPAREARTAPLPDSLQPALREALAGRGIHELYAHQAASYAAARARGNVIVTTGTASGKTLAFNLPVLDALAADRHARALYLYPTKALAQDQARSLG